MGGFDENAFMIASAAVAIAGVGIYMYDTRIKDSMSKQNMFSSSGYGNQGYTNPFQQSSPNQGIQFGVPSGVRGGKKTRKHKHKSKK